MIRETLQELGYEVLVAADGDQALGLVAAHSGGIALLLTDVVMPKVGGAELARRVGEMRPGIRVLYMSGYSNGAVSRQGILAPGMALLEKPFTTDDLARAVREALDRAPDGPPGER
jgi:CheY-like chemotaxis protein